MKYVYLFFLSLLTGYTYSMDSVEEEVIGHDEITGFVEITGFTLDRETITINKVIVKINFYVEAQNHKKAQKWLHRLELLVSADWKCFDIDQIEKYQEIYSNLSRKVDSLKTQNGPKLDTFKRLDEEGKLQKIESDWLIDKLEKDQCDIDWTELLGSSKKSFPSPKTLRKNRIKKLSEAGQIKTMDK